MAHACGPHTVEDFLAGKGPTALDLWQRLVAAVEQCGPFTYAPARTRVAFMVRVRFLAVTALSDRGMTFHMWLRATADASLVFRVDHLAPHTHIHWLRLTRTDQIDESVQDLLCAAYAVGAHRDTSAAQSDRHTDRGEHDGS